MRLPHSEQVDMLRHMPYPSGPLAGGRALRGEGWNGCWGIFFRETLGFPVRGFFGSFFPVFLFLLENTKEKVLFIHIRVRLRIKLNVNQRRDRVPGPTPGERKDSLATFVCV
eukprot:Hpha_TRINITY_DN15761_c6_g6::TRINITY_DN15761_c6_g6_i1::g.38598::m.38598